MKKKLVIFGAGLLLAAGAVFFATQNKPMTAEEALLLKNVEALAQGEDDDYYYNSYGCVIWDAVCYGVIVTPDGNQSLDILQSRN